MLTKLFVCVVVVAAMVGCAQGGSGASPGGGDGRDDGETGFDAGPPPGSGADAGSGAMDGGSTPEDGSMSDAGEALDGAVSDASATDAATDAATGDAGTMDAGPSDAGTEMDGGSDAGEPMDGGPACTVLGDCMTDARDVGSLAGDDDGAPLEATGTGAEWLTVTVTDTGAHWNDDDTLKAYLELESLDGADYDLAVYRATNSRTPMPRECSANEVVSEERGALDQVALSWADVTNSWGATDGDGRILSVRVTHAAGDCGSWRLTVRGNVAP